MFLAVILKYNITIVMFLLSLSIAPAHRPSQRIKREQNMILVTILLFGSIQYKSQ